MSRTALITGATGHLGSHFVLNNVGSRFQRAYLIVRGESPEIRERKVLAALEEANNSYIRRTSLTDIMQRLVIIEGDVSAPLVGLAEHDLTGLTHSQPDELWHFAASLNFEERKVKEIEATNLQGAKEILNLAKIAGISQLFHCSTAYTCGTQSGVIHPVPHPEGGPFSNHYERTKCAAENFLLSNCEDAAIKLVILRPSVVIGNSETHRPGGASSGLYGLIKQIHHVRHLLRKSPIPLRMHISESASVNCIPVDQLMNQIAELVWTEKTEGIYHLVSSGGPTNGEICDLVTRALDVESNVEIVGTSDERRTPLEKMLDRRGEFYFSYSRADRSFAPSASAGPPLTLDQMRRYVDEGVRALEQVDVTSILDFGTLTASDGARLNVYSAGPADAPVALICNAAGMPVEFVRPVAQRLAETCRVITWETRGLPSFYADAERLDYRMERQVRDGLEILEHFGVTDAVLLGWCAGTRIAMDIASTWRGTTSRIVLMNGGYPTEPPELTTLTVNMAATMPRLASNREHADEFYRILVGEEHEIDTIDTGGVCSVTDLIETAYDSNVDNIHLASLPFESPENLYVYANLLTPYVDTPQDLTQLPDVPTLILTCEGDLTAHPKSSTRFATEVLVHSQCVSLPEGDHFSLYWDNAYIDIVEDFVREAHPPARVPQPLSP